MKKPKRPSSENAKRLVAYRKSRAASGTAAERSVAARKSAHSGRKC